jgi:hypothetical protein
MTGTGPCPAGPLGAEGPPGPPTLTTLLREWVKEDPILNKHFFMADYNGGTYFLTMCNNSTLEVQASGYAIVWIPNEMSQDKRILIYYHGYGQVFGYNHGGKTLGYLRREDPLFIEKLRKLLVEGHDAIHKATNCKIEGEGNPEHIAKYYDGDPVYEVVSSAAELVEL